MRGWKGSRETKGEAEAIAQTPNGRRKMSDMTVKQKAVGKRSRASVKADILAPNEKNLKWWARWGRFIEAFLSDLEVCPCCGETINLVICLFMGCCGFVANKDKEIGHAAYIEPLLHPSLGLFGLQMQYMGKFSAFLSCFGLSRAKLNSHRIPFYRRMTITRHCKILPSKPCFLL
jgi:hypothetical protein